jgi:hypothetical protein
LRQRLVEQRVLERFRPLAAFKHRIRIEAETRICVSQNFYNERQALCRDPASCMWMFNVYLGTAGRVEQFSFADPRESWPAFLAPGCSYALVTREDWEALQPAARQEQSDRFRVEQDPADGTTLLAARAGR